MAAGGGRGYHPLRLGSFLWCQLHAAGHAVAPTDTLTETQIQLPTQRYLLCRRSCVRASNTVSSANYWGSRILQCPC